MNKQANGPGKDDSWERLAVACRRLFHDYANWLVGINWYRTAILSVGLLAVVGIVHSLPPFNLDLPLIPYQLGSPLMPMALWFILISIVVKVSYKGTIQAEVKAAQATEVAESEALKRQVVEARLAAMQAQVEPHFLFNTLASIEHLIETDPPRAGKMQRSLIALLRARMPTMREANALGTRDLGRELAVIRPYLEILKVRMEERLQITLSVSDGLLSAEFPPMMLQSLVENAIRHGLEPKADGGQLTVSAEIVHGKLALTVADTGLGFGKAETSGTGIGLNNIRERLALLYGKRANLNVRESVGGGATVTVTVPYIAHTDTERPTAPPTH
jgi:LytS/YehU family sensor histidine kinase